MAKPKQFDASGINVVSITNKGNNSFTISSQEGIKEIIVMIPDGVTGTAKKEANKLVITTICDDEPAPAPSMPGFDMRGQTVRGTQTNIAGSTGPIFSGRFDNPVVIMGDNVVTREPVAPQAVSVIVPDGLKITYNSEGGVASFIGHNGDIELMINNGSVKAMNYRGNIGMSLRGSIKVDVDNSDIGDLSINAHGSGRVRVNCAVKDLSVKTTGIDVVVQDYKGILGPYEVVRALFMVPDKDFSVSK